MLIKYFGENLSSSKLQIPGWAGLPTDNISQFWHFKQCTDMATSGVELIFPHQDTIIPEVIPPFIQINDLFFLLEMDLVISTPEKMNLLVLPHYRFYTDTEWSTPIPVATMVETDWYPRLSVIFKMPPKGYVTKFKKNEPFAQAIVVPRSVLKVERMNDKDIEKTQAANSYINEVAENVITRKWITSNGFVQDNLYEVLCHLEKRNQLPKEIKPQTKYRII